MLVSAYELDKAVYQFRLDFSKSPNWIYGNEIRTEEALTLFMQLFKQECLAPVNLEEFFQFDTNKILNEFQTFLTQKKQLALEESGVEAIYEEYNIFKSTPLVTLKKHIRQNLRNWGAGRLALSFDFETIAKEFTDPTKFYTLASLRNALETLNQEYRPNVQTWLGEISGAIEGALRYKTLDQKKYKIDEGHCIVERYFDELPNGDVVALNGWIFSSWDPLDDPVTCDKMFYLRRQIVIWGDLAKFRYTTQKETPGLWAKMLQYVRSCAAIFDGFRLDNFHNTPLTIAEEFLREARLINPDIYIFTE